MISDEEAKAAQEIAKLGQRSLDVASEAGGFFRKTFGNAIDHIAEAMADKAAAYRVRNRASVVQKTRKHLERLGVHNMKAIDFRNGLPLIEGISDESDDKLQEIWAAYLANALDPENSQVAANRQLIDVIRKLEPDDLVVLRGIPLAELEEGRAEPITHFAQDFTLSEDALDQSLARLTALGLFAFRNGPDLLAVGSANERLQRCRLTVETRIGEFYAMPLLMFFQRAILSPKEADIH